MSQGAEPVRSPTSAFQQVISQFLGSERSLVWLSGPRCSPTRLPLALAFSLRSLIQRCCNMGAPKREDFVILGTMAGSALAIYVLLHIVQMIFGYNADDRWWLINLSLNILGYSTVFLPGYLVIQYVRKTEVVERGGQLCLAPALKLCVFGSEQTIDEAITQESLQKGEKRPTSTYDSSIRLSVYFVGLMVSYLTWGVLQEKIMTRKYVDSTGQSSQFKDSQFLVFVNRILAFGIALLYIVVVKQPRHRAPLYKYSYCSFSNVMSSWFQYEALKFVSFPTQVLAKASKIIPVMIMGIVVSKKKYEYYEYIVALLISLGMVLFLFGSSEDRSSSSETTFSGLLLLIGYMTCDSFTSNWQNELFDTYKMTPFQMMCGVNLFSCILVAVSLIQQGTLYMSLVFMSQYNQFVWDCIVLSVCSAVGQLFIYRTINEFGAVTFIIMMTLRQAIAIFLSCIIYNHVITSSGVFGILVVFGAIFLKIYCSHRLRKLRGAQLSSSGVAATPK